jgi:hypothetical protein
LLIRTITKTTGARAFDGLNFSPSTGGTGDREEVGESEMAKPSVSAEAVQAPEQESKFISRAVTSAEMAHSAAEMLFERVVDHMPLLWALRDILGLTGTKYGCGIARCGACKVHIDGKAKRSCMLPVSAIPPRHCHHRGHRRAFSDPSATDVAQIMISGTSRLTPENMGSMPSFGDAYSDDEIAAGGQLCDRTLWQQEIFAHGARPGRLEEANSKMITGECRESPGAPVV